MTEGGKIIQITETWQALGQRIVHEYTHWRQELIRLSQLTTQQTDLSEKVRMFVRRLDTDLLLYAERSMVGCTV